MIGAQIFSNLPLENIKTTLFNLNPYVIASSCLLVTSIYFINKQKDKPKNLNDSNSDDSVKTQIEDTIKTVLTELTGLESKRFKNNRPLVRYSIDSIMFNKMIFYLNEKYGKEIIHQRDLLTDNYNKMDINFFVDLIQKRL